MAPSTQAVRRGALLGNSNEDTDDIPMDSGIRRRGFTFDNFGETLTCLGTLTAQILDYRQTWFPEPVPPSVLLERLRLVLDIFREQILTRTSHSRWADTDRGFAEALGQLRLDYQSMLPLLRLVEDCAQQTLELCNGETKKHWTMRMQLARLVIRLTDLTHAALLHEQELVLRSQWDDIDITG